MSQAITQSLFSRACCPRSAASFVSLPPSILLLLCVWSAMVAPLAAQSGIAVLNRQTRTTQVLEYLVTPSGLFPAYREVVPGDYMLVFRREGFEAPLELVFEEQNGKRLPLAALSGRAYRRSEIIRVNPGEYKVSLAGAADKTFQSHLRVDPKYRDKTQSNDRGLIPAP